MGRPKDDQTWLEERLDYLTKNEVFSQLNSCNAKLIKTNLGAWTLLKEMALAYYAPTYLTILRKYKYIKQINYLDMFAGSGVVGIEGLSKYYLGSPLVIKKTINKSFDNYYFIEEGHDKAEQLKRLLPEDNCFVEQGDANQVIDRILPKLSGNEKHTLIFIDPFAMEVEFETVKKLSKIKCDLIITVSTEEILRAVKQGLNNPNWNTSKVDHFFGDKEWKGELSEIKNDEEIFKYYSNRIEKYALKKNPNTTIIQKSIDGHHYNILFTSTGGSGTRPKFFNIIDDFNKRIKNLSGDQITSYLKHYIEAKGSSLTDFY